MNIDRPVIIFDGECKLCNGAVRFIIHRDPGAYFMFTPMQTAIAKNLLEQYQIENFSGDTFILISNRHCLFRTDAALEIARHLSGCWYLLGLLRIFPAGFRDFFYNLLAKNRYAIFGHNKRCMMPTQDVSNRFLE